MRSTVAELATVNAPPTAVRWMIDNGAPVRIEVDDGFPLLHLAIDRTDSAAHRADLVARLIAAGADIDERGANDWTPLMRAAAAGDREIVALLLGAGADRAARTRIDDFATAEEEMRYLGRLEMADFIRDWRPGQVRR